MTSLIKADEEQADIDDRLAAGTEETGTLLQIRRTRSGGDKNGAASERGGKGCRRLLAVTSCPTGIAHTYMAAEGLEKAARSRGWHIKVETRGSAGAKNVLTEQEIAEADCIIVAADAQVPMDRFDGKRVIECQVSDGISKADELLEQAAAGTVPIYRAAAGSSTASVQKNGKSGSVGHQIYVQLMNGVSHMLPFVVGGGILIAIAFLIDGFSVDINALPLEQRANFGSITPVAAWCKNVGGLAFNFHASGAGRVYRHGHRRPSGAGGWFCGRCHCLPGKIRLPGSAGGRLPGRLCDPGLCGSCVAACRKRWKRLRRCSFIRWWACWSSAWP